MSFKERYLRGDCSIDMINDYVEMWHGEGEIKKTLSEFLGLSQEEYVCWMISSDEELARMLSRSLPNRDLPYCARHIGWKELKDRHCSPLTIISRCSRPTAPTGSCN